MIPGEWPLVLLMRCQDQHSLGPIVSASEEFSYTTSKMPVKFLCYGIIISVVYVRLASFFPFVAITTLILI